MDVETLINPSGEKRIVERSASYPAIPLQEALQFANDISRSFPTTQHITREDIAAVLNKSSATIVREVAACAQFGLFSKDKEGYKISPLVKTIQNFLSVEEKKNNLVKAFSSPKLYSELISKFNGHVIPKELKTHLIRFHKISEKAAESAADTFIQSGVFAGVISAESNILNTNGVADEPPVVQAEETVTDDITDAPSNNPSDNHIFQKNNEQLLIPEIINEEKTKIRLTENKFCYLIYPRNLNQKDVLIIRKQVEMLEILTE